jgi:hypothetical protein
VPAQTITSGDITGSVTDATGAIIAGATVTLTNTATNTVQSAKTSQTGSYRFSLLAPGRYEVQVEQSGFQTTKKVAEVNLGQASRVDFQLAVSAGRQTVEVSEAAVAVQTENADLTTNFKLAQLSMLPNSGNDLTAVAYTAPGTIINTQAGYGNFSTFGLPASANAFTVNGNLNMDPYLSLNNSGATNLMLGLNEVAEVSVVSNAYSGQYGGLAGTQVNYVTKSGSNDFHGNAVYYWNGRKLNANNFFNNASDTPRPFVNANQWGWSVGGPFIKNKTFFFVDSEGLRVVLPTSTLVRIPSPQFASATLANLNSRGLTGAVPFYQNIFNLYAQAPGAAAATSVTGGGCGAFTGLGAGVPCALTFRSTAGNFTHEATIAGRVDQVLGRNDRLYARFLSDDGVQATYTDPISPIFNAFSQQPQYQGQLSETHTFGSTAVNQFIFSGSHYDAVFGPSDLAATRAAFPTELRFSGGLFSNMGGINASWPQGRKVTQWQIIDDFAKTWGPHTFKLGINWRKNDVEDLVFGVLTSGRVNENNLTDFFNGGGTGNTLTKRFPTAPSQMIRLNSFGAYVQDEWQVNPDFKVIATLRIDHNANPTCDASCFARLFVPFTELLHNPSIPYNQAIANNQKQAFPDTDYIVWQPRLGITWKPFWGYDTVVRVGGGIFANTAQASVVDSFARNSPQLNSFTVRNAAITPGTTGGLFDLAARANDSLLAAFNSGGTLASIRAGNPLFVVPNYTSSEQNIRQPRVYQWSAELQHSFWNNVVRIMYVGNRGVFFPLQNGGLNAYCPPAACPGGFDGLPPVQPDPRFGTVTHIQSSAISNYHGITFGLQRRFSAGFAFGVNYTWSHALDVVSNGGINPFDLNTAPSILNPQDPYNTFLYNYGNADYDVRHALTANYVWTDAVRRFFRRGPDLVFGGWEIAGTVSARSGLPFTVVDTEANATLAGFQFLGPIFATPLRSGWNKCGKDAVDTPCFAEGQFDDPTDSPTGFGRQTRNQYRGPKYVNTDFQITKLFRITERAKLGIGAQFFNIFNHPNFDKPINDVADPQFGQIILTVGSPTSIMGAFLGGDSSPRLIQLKAKIEF